MMYAFGDCTVTTWDVIAPDVDEHDEAVTQLWRARGNGKVAHFTAPRDADEGDLWLATCLLLGLPLNLNAVDDHNARVGLDEPETEGAGL